MPARPRDLERGKTEIAEPHVLAGERELRPGQHHVHRQPPAATPDEVLLCRREHLGRRLPRLEVAEKEPKTFRVDAHALAYGLELRFRLDRAGQVELDVPRHQLGLVAQSHEVPDGHHIVQAVDPDALAAQAPGKPLARLVGEDLLERRLAVLANVARLGREDDRRLSLARQQDVRVAVHDREAAHVRHGPLEARVLGAADDDGVEAVARHRLPDVRMSPGQLVHEASSPLTSAQTAWFAGVGTPWSPPKRTMPPLRKSTSVARRASTSCSIDALWSYATSFRAAWLIKSSGSASISMPCAAATAFPSSTSFVTSARRSGRSQTRPWVRRVSAPSGFVAALKMSFRHCGPRASATTCVGKPARVHASARRSICSIGAGRGSNGPKVVSPLTSHCT